MLKEKKATIGGILILLSVFLPVTQFVFEFDHGIIEENRWIFGQRFRVLLIKGGGTKSNLYLGVNVVGIVCAILLLILAIKIILIAYDDKGREITKLGISSILVFIFHSILEISQAMLFRPSFTLFLPHVGFVGIVLGGPLAAISGYKSR